MVVLIGGLLSAAVFIVVTTISAAYRRITNRRRSVTVRREIRDAFAHVDAVFREARRAMDAVTGMRERRPFGDWQDLL